MKAPNRKAAVTDANHELCHTPLNGLKAPNRKAAVTVTTVPINCTGSVLHLSADAASGKVEVGVVGVRGLELGMSAPMAGILTARCAFSDRNLHSRLSLDPTHVHLKLLHACDQ
jgi:hypothetical protein